MAPIRASHARWLDLGCILFSQYYDTVRWVGDEMAKRAEFASMDIGLYAGSNRSGFWREGRFQRCDRNVLKGRVRAGDLKLLLGTDAASEGLNLQRLGTLINIDLPWNPTRLEQRKGRIQRIGQARSEIWIANLRYRDSVEDRVHQVLADRLEAIHGLFGQIPDTLEDVWVQVALNDEQAAQSAHRPDHGHQESVRCEIQQGGRCRLGDLRFGFERAEHEGDAVEGLVG